MEGSCRTLTGDLDEPRQPDLQRVTDARLLVTRLLMQCEMESIGPQWTTAERQAALRRLLRQLERRVSEVT